MRTDLPSGTVTFLFTDIEGSTRLLHRLGPDAFADALAAHRAVLREAVAAHGGVEVDTQGDALFVAFATPYDAVDAAAAAQERLAGGPVRVRMGVHTGMPTSTEEGYVGVDVHRGARVAALAHGGQVVLSATTAALIDGVALRDLGRHRLKDFDAPAHLLQLGTAEFPPLRTPGALDLPTPATRFLGRERELFDAVTIWLERDPRLLTIVGPGGTGKTRFSIELARLLAEEADGGTVFVPLAALRDADLVLQSLAEALGAESAEPAAIAARVGARRTHLVVDNLEQLLPAAALHIARLVSACPDLRLLITSREALRIQGEEQLDLPPLASDEAADLFVARAQSLRPEIGRTLAIDELCERLDRMPLAIELAAARVKLLSPEVLLERVGARLDLLRGSRDAEPRHATLRATIAWSHDLLDDAERSLFARLAVYPAGCTLDNAESVLGADVAGLESLLDKSLLRRRADPDGTDRFWMHETIREFAAERLTASGDEDTLRRAQCEAYLRLGKAAHLAPHEDEPGDERGNWQPERVAPELDNVRTVLAWALSRDPERGLRVAAAIQFFWVVREPVEGASWLRQLLDAAPEADPGLRAASLLALAGSLEIYGELDDATPVYAESLRIFEQVGSPLQIANGRARVATNAWNRGDPDDVARTMFEESLADARLHGSRALEATMLNLLAEVAIKDGDLDTAAGRATGSARIASEIGWSWWEAHSEAALAEIERARGRLSEAERHAAAALALAQELGDRMTAVFSAAELALVAVAQDDAESAGRLWGAIEAEEAAAPIGQWPAHRDAIEAQVLSLRGPEFERARTDGRLLTLTAAARLSRDVPETMPKLT